MSASLFSDFLKTPQFRTGTALWTHDETNQPIIDGVLWEGDVLMLLGSEKAGKSILGLQLAFCLTSGQPFLDKYAVPVPCSVLYIQTEGKPSEMVERMLAMRETLEIDDTRFYHLHQRFLPLRSAEHTQVFLLRRGYLVDPESLRDPAGGAVRIRYGSGTRSDLWAEFRIEPQSLLDLLRRQRQSVLGADLRSADRDAPPVRTPGAPRPRSGPPRRGPSPRPPASRRPAR